MGNWDWVWVRQEFVFTVHNDQVGRHGGSEGHREPGGVERAIAFSQNLAAYGDFGSANLAAGYLVAVTKNHAVLDGDKCTAWLT